MVDVVIVGATRSRVTVSLANLISPFDKRSSIGVLYGDQ